VIYYHDRSVSKAISGLFPEINFDRSKFRISQANYWSSGDNARMFLEEYAKKNHFDALQAEHWYSQSPDKLSSIKVFFLFLFLPLYSSYFLLANIYYVGDTKDHTIPSTQFVKSPREYISRY